MLFTAKLIADGGLGLYFAVSTGRSREQTQHEELGLGILVSMMLRSSHAADWVLINGLQFAVHSGNGSVGWRNTSDAACMSLSCRVALEGWACRTRGGLARV